MDLLICVNIYFELSKELSISLTIILCKVSYTCNLPNEYPYVNNLHFISSLEDGVVLVHCNAGVSRAAAVVIGFLMNSERLSFARAFSLVKNARPAACPNPGFMEQLHKYQEQILKANGSINNHDWSKERSEMMCFDYTGRDIGCILMSFWNPLSHVHFQVFIYFFSYPPLTLFFPTCHQKAKWCCTDFREVLPTTRALIKRYSSVFLEILENNRMMVCLLNHQNMQVTEKGSKITEVSCFLSKSVHS